MKREMKSAKGEGADQALPAREFVKGVNENFIITFVGDGQH